MAPLIIEAVWGHDLSGPMPTSIEPSVTASHRAAYELALDAVLPTLTQPSAATIQTFPGTMTSPGDRILASIQGSRSLAAAAVPSGEEIGSARSRAEARLERA